jgi:dipeptidyl aminopeptidase/acylaminoacyl peptidase
MNRAAPSFKMRFMYMSGHEDESEFDRFVEKFSLFPIARDIKCPVLIQAGEDDELSALEFSDELVGEITSQKKFVIYEGERHAIGGNNLSSALGENWFTMLADWCLDRVEGRPAPNERVFIDSLGRSEVTPFGRVG